ncbi:Uncharacterized membrane protein YckC, RDD family [Anaerovirgula multivorans]|uniref:Uncharacterized membrane protein YckC, RDD family n=1 Tax=Anaerovirgula multivorans TaxID=312168 RepID=A0A239CM60_9FIRM|nr:RDD family protein [Anaerovirgula multivorans]SNS21227.1 Uncharacterized membrane protein YckC, RDD family [Anaerovirgula multivorans]
MFCRNCGKKVNENSNLCSRCGFDPLEESHYCQECGDATKENQKVCVTCGFELHNKLPVEYAGFFRRLAAMLLDVIFSVMIYWIYSIILPIVFMIIGIYTAEFSDIYRFTFFVPSIPFLWLYFALTESSQKQATLGKRALGIIVVDTNMNRISFGAASSRFFGKFLSNLIFGIGYIMAAFTEHNQTLHDKLAKCYVVKKGSDMRKKVTG